jgi:hypothetical protein
MSVRASDSGHCPAGQRETPRAARYAELLRLTRSWVEQGRLDAAAACCREAIECAPGRAGPHGVLANALALTGRLDEAAAAAAAALERAPRDPLMLHLSASIALQRSLPDAAIAWSRRALELDPHDQRALADLAFAMDCTGADRDAAPAAGPLLDLGRLVRVSDIDVPSDQIAASLLGAAALAPTSGAAPLAGGRRLNDLFSLTAPWVVPLRDALRAAVEGYVADLAVSGSHPVMTGRPAQRELTAWANVMSSGDHERPHIHEGAWLSGVYYVEMPAVTGQRSDAGCGALLLGGHCSVPECERGLLRIEPRPGRIVLFPSYLCHRTEPFTGPGLRISIAFDVPRHPGARR